MGRDREVSGEGPAADHADKAPEPKPVVRFIAAASPSTAGHRVTTVPAAERKGAPPSADAERRRPLAIALPDQKTTMSAAVSDGRLVRVASTVTPPAVAPLASKRRMPVSVS